MRQDLWVRKMAVLVLLWACSLAASAAVYKWTDADGRLHFGDRPPQAGAETVPLPSAPASMAPVPSAEQRQENQNKLLNAFEAERQLNRAAQDKAQQEKAERERNCAEARERLQAGIRSSAMYQENEAGERVYFDEAQREQAIQRGRQDVEAWCGKP